MSTETKQTPNLDDELSLLHPESVKEEEKGEEETQESKVVIPEKFKNKSLEDVIQSYTQLESEYGRRSNEVGDLRKLTDELLGLQLKKDKSVEDRRPISSDDLFEDPDKTINEAVSSNPEIKQLKEQLEWERRERNRLSFEAQHSDWMSVVSSSEFQSWVQQSPTRMRMLREADQNYDYALAAELIDLYKEVHKTNVRQKEVESVEKTKQDLKDSITERGSTGSHSKKVYSRQALLELRMKNPEKYDAMYEQIAQAYLEGRVK